MGCAAGIQPQAGREDKAGGAGDPEPEDLFRLRSDTGAGYLADRHGIPPGRETVRTWMIAGQLWRAQRQSIEKIHAWRPRRSRVGELVQWDTSEHAWLEERGPRLYLISIIDDASSRLHARFVLHDSTAENMRLLWS
jgi:hypothetical protein